MEVRLVIPCRGTCMMPPPGRWEHGETQVMNTGEGIERRPANKWVGAHNPDVGWPHRRGSRGLGGGVGTCVRPAWPLESGGMCGDFPPT